MSGLYPANIRSRATPELSGQHPKPVHSRTNSNYSSLDMFDSIENQYVEFEGLAKLFCLLGDFNARSGSLGDFLDINRHLADHLLLDEYCYNSDKINILESCDIPVNRSSQDNTTNKYGERFLELCKNTGICIMNGRSFLDKGIGRNICDGKSVVDYVVCSPEVLKCCSNFEVLEFDSLLHCPVKVEFKQNYNSIKSKTKSSECANHNYNKVTLWSNEVKHSFMDCIDENKVNDTLKMLEHCNATDVKQLSIDKIVSDIGDIFKSSASYINIMETISINQNCTRRKLSKKPWFNNNCENARNNFFKAKKYI